MDARDEILFSLRRGSERLERVAVSSPANRANGSVRIPRVPYMVLILRVVELPEKTLVIIVGDFRAACPACVGYHRRFHSILTRQVCVVLQPSSPPLPSLLSGTTRRTCWCWCLCACVLVCYMCEQYLCKCFCVKVSQTWRSLSDW